MWLWNLLVRWPVKMLYFHGPKQLGMWQGETFADICGRETGVDSIFWMQHPLDCEELINKKFNAFMVTIQSILYLLVVYKIFSYFFWRYTFVLPLTRLLQHQPLHLLPQSKHV